MTLPVRYRPGSLLERAFPLREPLAAEFDELFERMNRFLAAAAPAWTEAAGWSPLADLRETDDAFVVECELPGLKREDIDVEIGDRELCITGELKERETPGVLRRGTRHSGRFEYRTLLPSEAKAEEVSACLTDGILTVTVPKAQATKPRHIEITT
ncbi:Hsp20/alpha crystallin family protein [Kitasatospora sp. NPDC056531]|uniref:Hsp20/alpha crystallin family protein n=1 Tax=Kitasatospora sp. NPDC056531 TaxID=3345856 RepID=UPI0036C3DFF7